MSSEQLDTRGLLCPLPVIRAQDRVSQLSPGDTLEVRASDPGAFFDIPSWAKVHGHTIVTIIREGDEIVITLKVGS